MNTIQFITKNGNNLLINDIPHILNTDFCEKVDTYSIHISLDENKVIRLFESQYTIINDETSDNAEGLATLFGLNFT
jgi:hypothetical protein